MPPHGGPYAPPATDDAATDSVGAAVDPRSTAVGAADSASGTTGAADAPTTRDDAVPVPTADPRGGLLGRINRRDGLLGRIWRLGGPVPLWRQPLVIVTAVLLAGLLAVVIWVDLPARLGADGSWVNGSPSRPRPQASAQARAGMPAAPPGPGVTMQRGGIRSFGHFAWDDDFDGEVTRTGLNARNGAHLTPWTSSATPTPSDCAAIERAKWTELVPARELTVGARYCYLTSEDRYGLLTVRAIALNGDKVRSLSSDYVTWRGLED